MVPFTDFLYSYEFESRIEYYRKLKSNLESYRKLCSIFWQREIPILHKGRISFKSGSKRKSKNQLENFSPAPKLKRNFVPIKK